jgi:hypothetical protein
VDLGLLKRGGSTRTFGIIQKLDVADHQCRVAIRLYQAGEDLICSVTLAGAASNCLKDLLEIEFEIDPLGLCAEILASIDRVDANQKEIIRGEKADVNWLKHYTPDDVRHPDYDWDDAALSAIDSAIENLNLTIALAFPGAEKHLKEIVSQEIVDFVVRRGYEYGFEYTELPR